MFIKKMIQKNEAKKELARVEKMKSNHQTVLDVEHSIKELKQYINMFDERKKTINDLEVHRFMRTLRFASEHYHFFLYLLKRYEHTYKTTYSDQQRAYSKEHMEFLLEMRKEFRKEFEIIYDRFKRLSKNVNFPHRNEILGKMRTAFDFDGSKFNKQEHFPILN